MEHLTMEANVKGKLRMYYNPILRFVVLIAIPRTFECSNLECAIILSNRSDDNQNQCRPSFDGVYFLFF